MSVPDNAEIEPQTRSSSSSPWLRWWRNRPQSTYWLTRFLILRWLGFIYFIAFCVAANQFVPLAGEHGLLPAPLFMQTVQQHFGSRWESFLHYPSIFWLGFSDQAVIFTAWFGAALSLVVLAGYANAIMMIVLWALYMSFINMGQEWYGYGWEIQLLETGLLGAFLCPMFDPRPFPRCPPPVLVIWLNRWLIFRIMLGAGLIKLRGDPCWRDLTCMYYHYETQPIPSPISWWMHFRPHWFHQLETLWNHIIELVVPFFVFGPRRVRHIAGVLLVSFQGLLIWSGNLSFLNWLTITPALACFDDSFLRYIFRVRLSTCAINAAGCAVRSRCQQIAVGGYFALVAYLSIDPVLNLWSQRQVMNTSFGPLSIVNTYGAFGSVGQVRREIVFEGTTDTQITSTTSWREYDFKAKPGNPERRPAIVAPYHYRLDWAMWFAAMSGPADYPWTLHLVWKLLHNDPQALSLIGPNPFRDGLPHYVHAVLYEYHFAPPGSSTWWTRERLGEWLPPLSADSELLQQVLRAYGWVQDSADSRS